MAGRIWHPFSKPTRSSQAPVGEIRTSVTVAGDISGQLAVGSHIVQMRVDTVLGNLVTVLPPDAKANVTARPVPISLVPRRPALLIGRQDETTLAVQALSSRRAVELYAPAGMGKSTLLRSLAHQLPITETCGGMAHLSARGLSHDDLLQVLFDVFYASDIPVKPSPGELRHRLQHVRAALLLDDVDLSENDIEDVEDFAPECGFVLTTASDPGLSEAVAIELTGLHGADARELIAHGLGRPLGPEEQPAVDAICDLVHGAPAGLLRLAAAAREHDGTLADFAATVAASGVPPLPVESAEDVWLLGLLAAIPGVHLDVRQLSELTRMTDVQERIDRLIARGLVLASAPPVSSGARVDYGLAAGVDLGPGGVWQMEQRRAELRNYFLRLSEERSDTLLAPGAPPETLRALHSDAAKRREWRYVLGLGVLLDAAYALSGRWDAWREVSQNTLSAARALGDPGAEAMALHQLGTRALCEGETSTATDLLRSAFDLRTAIGDVAAAQVTAHNLSLIVAPPPLPPEQQDASSTGDDESGVFADDTGATGVDPSGIHAGSSGAHASSSGVHAGVGHGAISGPVLTTGASLLVVSAVVAGALLLRSDDPAAADVALDQTALAFPAVALNQASESRTIAARNVGETPVHLNGFLTSGLNGSEFVVTSSTCRNREIGVGESCEASVVFTPTGAGPRQASLAVDIEESTRDPVATLSGSSPGPDAALLSASPTELSFGEQPLNVSGQRRQLSVTGPSGAPVVLGAASVAGLEGADFAVEDNSCSGVQLLADVTCTIGVRFAPSAEGRRQGLLTLPGPDGVPALAVPLSGTGAAPDGAAAFEVDPRSVSFGERPLSSPSEARQVLLTNSGDAPLDISPVSVQGAPDFTIGQAACPAVLEPGADCAAEVVFTPVTTGPRTAQLLFGGRGPAVPLSGAGEEPRTGAPDISPRALAFPDQLLGGVSSPMSVTVTNRADRPLRLSPGVATGTTGAFRFDGSGCTGRDVEPGASCDIAVTFAPTAAGGHSGVLLLTAEGFPDVAVVLGGVGIDTRAPPVPDVIGMTLARAQNELTAAGFVTGEIREVAHPDIPRDSVSDQVPRAGFPLDRGGAVDLYVSTGPDTVLVPDVVGLTESEAAVQLVDAGLRVGAVRLEINPDVPHERIISSDPAAESEVAAGTPVDLTVSAGDTRPQVPDVVGLTEPEAVERIVDAGLLVGTIERPYDESIPKGEVISSDPVATTRVEPGSAVRLVVSSGPPPVTVPHVVGRVESDARAEIERVGLQVGTVTPVADCSIPADEVISSAPPAGTEVDRGGEVGLTVSTGEPQAVVPEVSGLTESEATAALQGAGFRAYVIRQSDESIPNGIVIASDPAAGTSASTCEQVTLTVSTGPELLPVPRVVGSVKSDAETMLVGSGFQVGAVTSETSCQVPADVVLSSDPEGGSQETRGTPVNLVVSSGEPMATVPSVAGQTQSAAESTLAAAGFRVTVVDRDDDAVPEGQVIETDPAGTTSASTCVPVTVVVSSGPPLVTVPVVVGDCEEVAAQKLRDLGLVPLSENSPDPSEEPIGEVLSSTPKAGSQVEPGSTVTLVLANGSDGSVVGYCSDPVG
jgi:beta-lactam-binding protein with PASTA domain